MGEDLTYALADDYFIRLLSWRGCIIEPLRQEGAVGEAFIGQDGQTHQLHAADPYDRHTPFVLARILHVHPACTDVRPGMVCVTQAHAFERVTTAHGDFFLMHENSAVACIEGFDAENDQDTERQGGHEHGTHAHQPQLADQGP